MTSPRWVRAGTEGAPLIAVHTWRDEDRHYARLSKAMGDRIVHSILPPEPGVDPMPRRVEDWVDHHDGALRSLGVEPPHRLLGWSFGGVVAVELARRLRARGEAVEFVGLIDTIRPILRPLDDREYLWQTLADAAEMPTEARGRYLRHRLAFVLARRYPRVVGIPYRRLRRATGRGPAAGIEEKPADPLVVAVHTAYLNYRGDPVPFPVHLYGTRESLERTGKPALRWLPWLHGGYEQHQVPGEHFTLFDAPHVERLAEVIATGVGRSSGPVA